MGALFVGGYQDVNDLRVRRSDDKLPSLFCIILFLLCPSNSNFMTARVKISQNVDVLAKVYISSALKKSNTVKCYMYM